MGMWRDSLRKIPPIGFFLFEIRGAVLVGQLPLILGAHYSWISRYSGRAILVALSMVAGYLCLSPYFDPLSIIPNMPVPTVTDVFHRMPFFKCAIFGKKWCIFEKFFHDKMWLFHENSLRKFTIITACLTTRQLVRLHDSLSDCTTACPIARRLQWRCNSSSTNLIISK